jgi:hypothetical protein
VSAQEAVVICVGCRRAWQLALAPLGLTLAERGHRMCWWVAVMDEMSGMAERGSGYRINIT